MNFTVKSNFNKLFTWMIQFHTKMFVLFVIKLWKDKLDKFQWWKQKSDPFKCLTKKSNIYWSIQKNLNNLLVDHIICSQLKMWQTNIWIRNHMNSIITLLFKPENIMTLVWHKIQVISLLYLWRSPIQSY